MLGPIKKNPNGNIFWKECGHQNPKKVLHPSVCLSVFFNHCTVKVCSSNRHYLFMLPTHSWTPSSAPFHYFVRLKGFILEGAVLSVIFQLESRLRFFWFLEKNVGTDRSEVET